MSLERRLDKLELQAEAQTPAPAAEVVVMTDDERASALLHLYSRCPELLLDPEDGDLRRDLFVSTGRLPCVIPLLSRLREQYEVEAYPEWQRWAEVLAQPHPRCCDSPGRNCRPRNCPCFNVDRKYTAAEMGLVEVRKPVLSRALPVPDVLVDDVKPLF